MKRTLAAGALAAIALSVVPARVVRGGGGEKAVVVCTLPTLAAIAREVGGERFSYVSLAKPDQDPHFVSPTPGLMRKASRAELLIEIGMQLELWADRVADGSGNPRIFRSGPGFIQVSRGIPKEEVPTVITRAAGDLHPEGNPHLWLDPVRAKMIARAIARALAGIAPAQAPEIRRRLADFDRRVDRALFGQELVDLVGGAKLSRLVLDGTLWPFLETTTLDGKPLAARIGGWLRKAAPLRGVKAVEYHKVWIYFAKTFGMQLLGTIEERPGIPPGPSHQRQITELIRDQGVKIVMVDNFYDPSLPRAIARETGAKVVILPNQVGGEPGTENYFALIDYIIGRLVAALS